MAAKQLGGTTWWVCNGEIWTVLSAQLIGSVWAILAG